MPLSPRWSDCTFSTAPTLTSVDAHAGAEQAAARRLEHGDVDLRVGEHHARRDRARHVALHRALAVDVDAVGRGEPGRVAGHLGDVREHARRRGLAVRAGDRGDRHARRRARREQHVDHGPGDVARRALARRHVHAEARARRSPRRCRRRCSR